MTLEQRALGFATLAHASVGQRRKYTGESYIQHPIAVAELVRSVPHTEEMIAAAYLHDVIEDCEVNLSEIRREFGIGVSVLVNWLTDVSRPEDGNRAHRKLMDREHLAKAPPAAQTIKVADLIDNTASIFEHDPKFARVYIPEKAELLGALTKADPLLLMKARLQVAEYEEAMKRAA